jgi:ribosomal protein L27
MGAPLALNSQKSGQVLVRTRGSKMQASCGQTGSSETARALSWEGDVLSQCVLPIALNSQKSGQVLVRTRGSKMQASCGQTGSPETAGSAFRGGDVLSSLQARNSEKADRFWSAAASFDTTCLPLPGGMSGVLRL